MAWRSAAWGSLAAALLLHLFVLAWLRDALNLLDPRASAMQRMQATYTRVVTLGAAPAGATPGVRAPATAPATARAADSAASAAAAARHRREQAHRAAEQAAQRAAALAALRVPPAPLPDDMPVAQPPAPEIIASAPSALAASAAPPNPATASAPGLTPGPQPEPGASAPAALAGASAPANPFSWPASTRLDYRLRGWYQGEVHGTARVEWLREGDRYQTHLEVYVGPTFAPLVSRRMSSEGRITPDGLAPSRYEQETRQMLRAARLASMRFDAAGITLASGQRVSPLADVQDTASQFIQLIYLFSTRPELRQAGRAVEIGLALPNRADRWVYEVGPMERQTTPAGEFETFHVRPRRAAAAGELSAEIWYAPRLAMLPVRFRIRQDADTYVDLFLEQAPQQAAP